VRKTTLCSYSSEEIDGCAWLDSDLCWMINSWKSKTEEQKDVCE
jgi:hypothetical protein